MQGAVSHAGMDDLLDGGDRSWDVVVPKPVWKPDTELLVCGWCEEWAPHPRNREGLCVRCWHRLGHNVGARRRLERDALSWTV